MKVIFVEVTSQEFNWGKFAVGRFEESEINYMSKVAVGLPLFYAIGLWNERILIFDLQTEEGTLFGRHDDVHATLQKHAVWVCPLYEPFATWLLAQPDPFNIPAVIDLPNVPRALSGYRRPGLGARHAPRPPRAPWTSRAPRSTGTPAPAATPASSRLFYTHDAMPICWDHFVAAFQQMRPPYLEKFASPQDTLTEVDPISRGMLELSCAMCEMPYAPGRTCEHCGTPLDEQWPKVYCSNSCALADG